MNAAANRNGVGRKQVAFSEQSVRLDMCFGCFATLGSFGLKPSKSYQGVSMALCLEGRSVDNLTT